jgi:phosphoenolpyruvate synthase
MKYIKFFSEISAEYTALVGGKNANLGEMYNKLADVGVPVPNGFAVTAEGYDYFIKFNNLEEKIHDVLKGLDTHNIEDLHKRGEEIRNLIKSGEFPEDLKNEILTAFQKLKEEYGEDLTVAVRSSATAEDLPGASFAGQQETYLNVSEKDLLEKIKFCFASLFTDRAISYREDKGFDHFKVKLSVAVQKMVRSDVGSSGVMFTIDPDNGCPNVIVINSVFGLGELIVQGKVVPDEFIVFKPKLPELNDQINYPNDRPNNIPEYKPNNNSHPNDNRINYPNNRPNGNEIFGQHSGKVFSQDSGNDLKFGNNSGNAFGQHSGSKNIFGHNSGNSFGQDSGNNFVFPIISKKLGDKNIKIIYSEGGGVKEVETTEEEKRMFSLTDEEVKLLAKYGYLIEKHYGKAMDIEWAKDEIENKLYIVQARPETVHSTKQNVWYEYRLKTNDTKQHETETKPHEILKGIAIGSQITAGKVRVIRDVEKINEFQAGEILVTEMTNPDWEPIMKIAKGIITEKGGRTCHAAIVARELGIPSIVGVSGALEKLKTGDEITIDNSQGLEGKIYQGILEYEVIEHKLEEIPQTKTKVYVNIGEPDEALEKWYLPVKGVGLAREEFIIASEIKIHPNALIDYENLKKKAENYPNNRPNKLPESSDRIDSTRITRPNNNYPNKQPNGNGIFGQNSGKVFGQDSGSDIRKIIEKIDELTKGYEDKKQFYIDKLAEGIAKIGVAFWPNEVIVRFSDFKTNEYRNLIGGEIYEPKEENPMIGWRGASRYYHPNFRKAFELEVLAFKRVREEMKLKNVVPMVPFCRTPEEGKEVVKIIRSIIQDPELKIYVMAEIPSNVLLADEFLEIFDGMSIGSNDLTQLALGIDRDNEMLTQIGDERNPAVLKMLEEVIRKCKEKNKYVGICGQAPSDFPEIVEFLVKNKIDSISVNPDAVIKTINLVKRAE